MNNLVAGLRNMGLSTCSEAADEIERLQKRLSNQEQLLREITDRAWQTSVHSNTMRYVEFNGWLTEKLLEAGYRP